MNKNIKFLLGVFAFSIIISVPLLIPYLHQGSPQTHDGHWWVIRLSEMFREVKDLQFPPRYSGYLNFGYGYPLFNFTYPFPFYLGLLIKFLGFGFVDSIKIIFAASIPISAFFMFMASRNIWKSDYAGIISSILYLYFPYRLVDLYVRGSIGEAIGFAIIPIIIYCISKTIDNPADFRYRAIGGISYGLLILTHNITSVLFTFSIFILLIGYYSYKKINVIKPFISILGMGVILSSFFWIPAFFEKHYISLSVTPIADKSANFITVKDLLFSSWGYGASRSLDSLSYQLGWPFLLVLISVVCLIAYQILKKNKKTNDFKFAFIIIAGVALFSFMLFKESNFLWKLPVLADITFPWIVLSQLGLLIAILAGYLVKFKPTKYIALFIVIIALILYLPKAKPVGYTYERDNFYLTNDDTTTTSKELMPLWVKKNPTERPLKKVEIIQGEGKIEALTHNSKKISFKVNLSDKSIVRINTIYYPGWRVFSNNSEIPINYNNDFGVMDLALEKGEYQVVGRFSETNLRIIANLISLAGVIFIIFMIFKIYLFKKLKLWK